jgi:hypothetical protein
MPILRQNRRTMPASLPTDSPNDDAQRAVNFRQKMVNSEVDDAGVLSDASSNNDCPSNGVVRP